MTASFTRAKGKKKSKLEAPPPRRGSLGHAWGAEGAVPHQRQPPAPPPATEHSHRHLQLCPPGSARDSVPEPAPAGPAPLSPPPLSARARAWTSLPKLGRVPLPHTRRPTPSASPKEKRPGAWGRGRRSARLLTSGWRRGTQPASASYSSGPSAILVLNPSARCMPGESVHPRGARVRRRASGRASASPAGGDASRLPLRPLPPDAPSAPAPRRARVPARARAREPGRPRGSALCCTARGGGRAALGVGCAAGGGPSPRRRCVSGGPEKASGGPPSLSRGEPGGSGAAADGLGATEPWSRAQAAEAAQAPGPTVPPRDPSSRDPGGTGTRFKVWESEA